ncbi:hypothetical protein ACT9ST_25880 (plasmid) [Sphingobium limneticum]|jgi:hypothetical protein|uniref:Uncharacterized protein n=1 Tax=Novosphingobium silvae TaxID=2692619 RepID=A0A7X4GK58_9SPHN|nr:MULTISPECIES: hypothetical protein [Alphaproteobacteria]MYL99134.1 hypothetical protein [Novosphingobium silvae]RSV13993.1 hypothetical protein CA235_13910 [Sphingomonas sp. ABOLF]TAJ29194.1 MAG: hypothetical protein EPO59_16280 [Bosea sp. (in: a-proteobacteria)]|tara:strand:+ start:1835 stop:2158 length:324 start_codon:yes stop_codon:yes gene_type:complete
MRRKHGLRIGTPSLSPQEWIVVVSARRASMRSLREPGRAQRLFRSLFGWSEPRPHESERLEALRRAAIYMWHGASELPDKEMDRFLAAGFSIRHYQDLVEGIAEMRG